jgi:hypothetical protein
MFLLCKGVTTINGTISMSGKGASASGQPFVIWSGATIPAVGGTGAAKQQALNTTTTTTLNGIAGGNATSRGTGGGGSGAIRRSGSTLTYSIYGGKGTDGTTWSGGYGGGAVHTFNAGFLQNSNTPDPITTRGGNGRSNFGQNATSDIYIGGGAGGTGGIGGLVEKDNSALVQQGGTVNGVSTNGTAGAGGLLMIAAMNTFALGTNGRLRSEGTSGGTGTTVSGGSSGGGSINVLIRKPTSSTATTTIQNSTYSVVTGGTSPSVTGTGGAGGAGSAIAESYTASLRQSLFEAGGTYYKYNGASWVAVSGGTELQLLQSEGMFDEEMLLIDRSKMVLLYSELGMNSVNVRVHAP